MQLRETKPPAALATGIHYRVLGPLEVTRGPDPLQIPANKQRILLATLLLNANGIVPTDELIEHLWDNPPSDARGTAQAHLRRLRHTLGDLENGGRIILTSPSGYMIRTNEGNLDLERFNLLISKARTAEASRDFAGAVKLLRESLGLWQGRPLSNVESSFLQHNEVPNLVERRLHAAERYFELELLQGNHADIIAEVAAVTRSEPFRERFWMQLMTALYRDGRQGEALACYQQVTKILRDELGLDPSPDLKFLHNSILNHSPELAISTRRPPVPMGHAGALISPDQLPAELTDFVGREAALQQIMRHLGREHVTGRSPIVVISGPPGVGKTTLAVRAAHALSPRFPDELLFLRLDGTVADRRPAILREPVEGRKVLVVIDDVSDVDQARKLHSVFKGCALLITSHRRLAGLPGAMTVIPGPFTPDEAREFLENLVGERTRREPRAAAQITATCGYLPLAIRIAGNRLALRPGMRLTKFADQLAADGKRLAELSSPDMDVRGKLQQIYAHLTPDARLLLGRAGLLADTDFAAWVPQALLGKAGDSALEDLIEANLVEPIGVDSMGEPRYRTSGLIAGYANDLLENASSVEREKALNGYTRAVKGLAAWAYSRCSRSFELLPADDLQVAYAMADVLPCHTSGDPALQIVIERSHILDVIKRTGRGGQYEDAGQLLAMVLPMLSRHGLYDLSIRSCAEVGGAAREAGDESYALRVDYQRAVLLAKKGELGLCSELLKVCVAGFERDGARPELARALALLSLCRSCRDISPEPSRLAAAAIGTAREADDPHAELIALNAMAQGLAVTGGIATARKLLDTALGKAGRLAEPDYQAATLDRIAWLASLAGDLMLAEESTAAGNALAQCLGDRQRTAWMLFRKATTEAIRGRHDEAIKRAGQSREIFVDIRNRRGEACALGRAAEAYLALGRPATAANLLATAVHLFDETGAGAEREHAAAVLAACRAATTSPAGQHP